MPEINLKKTKAFKTSSDLRQWLETNHEVESELLIKIFKKGSKIPSVTWNEVVLEALCWGWIDGVKKSIDDEAYVQRITPRKLNSNWSKTNTRHVEKLIEEGRMAEPGLVHVRAAKADGRWENAYAPASEMEVPADFIAALQAKPKLMRFYETLTKTNLYAIAYGLQTAKKPETRQRRFDKFIGMLAREEKPDFGFKKKTK